MEIAIVETEICIMPRQNCFRISSTGTTRSSLQSKLYTINELCANEIATVEKLGAFVSRSRGSSTINLERRVHDACMASLIEARICRLFSLSRVEPWLVLRNVSYYTKETLSSVGRRLRHRTVYRDAATIAAFSALVSQITSCPYVCSFLLSQSVPRCFCDWSRLPMEPPVN